MSVTRTSSTADFAPGLSNLRSLIREVPDFPTPGVSFKDITPLLADPAGLALAVEYMAQPFRGKRVDAIIGAESRGFVFGTAVAQALSAGFIPVRKPGKLPGPVRRCEYQLEYGSDALEIRADAIQPGQTVLVIDDVMATGGTLEACCKLADGLGAKVAGVVVLIELTDLGGRKRLAGQNVASVLRYGANGS